MVDAQMRSGFDAAGRWSLPPSRWLLALEGRTLPELAMFLAARPLLSRAPRGDGHAVLAIPGLVASDMSMKPLCSCLRSLGYDAGGWGMGRNFGPTPELEAKLLARVREMRRSSGRKVSLIGWSLGGLYARQIAKLLPDDVRCVITLGSPFKGGPRATNAWRVYEYVSGHRAEDRDRFMGGPIETPPPVPFTSIYSRSDGVCAWRACREEAGPLAENIEVESSHCGLPHNVAAAFAIADRLAQPADAQTKFDRSGWRAWIFRDPDRA